MKKQLTVTLKSDLCSGSGDGFSSGIDTDVCFDKDGLPYIPGRRIKGCLLAAAQDIGVDASTRAALFGSSGDVAGCLRIMNARLKGGVSHGGQQVTLDRYTYTRAHTKMNRENGSALDNTLRYVRVIKHYLPATEEEMRFVAPLEVKDEYVEELERIAKALRNIGQERNRGLGAVCCRVGEPDVDDVPELGGLHRASSNGRTTISFRVRLKSPVMLPQQSGGRSAGYIPGSSVLGCLASKLAGRNDFDDLFLSGNVRFSPLYPVDDAGNRCLPAGPIVVKVKGGARNGSYLEAHEFTAGPLEAAKPLKEGFMSPTSWKPVEVETEINYHHSTGKDGTLYTQECLSQGQCFAGFIDCPGNMATVLEQALLDGDLSFGRSKTAQYSRCALEECDIDYGMMGETIDVVEGHRYAFLLDSDVLIADQGRYTTRYKDLERHIAEGCGVWFARPDIRQESPAGEDPKPLVTSISYRKVTGFNAKWRHKRPHVTAFAAGSCIGFTASSSQERVPVVMYVGDRQAEGFGRVLLVDCDAVEPVNNGEAPVECAGAEPVTTREACRLLAVGIADAKRRSLFQGAHRLSPTFVSRLTRMAQESQDAVDLDVRLQSIKDTTKQETAVGLVDELFNIVRERLGHADWDVEQECLVLVLTLGKYFQMQVHTNEGGQQ